MFAVKKVLRSMFTGKIATTVNLNKLSEKTTLSEIADMLASPEFVIEDLDILASDTAEFRNEITDRDIKGRERPLALGEGLALE